MERAGDASDGARRIARKLAVGRVLSSTRHWLQANMRDVQLVEVPPRSSPRGGNLRARLMHSALLRGYALGRARSRVQAMRASLPPHRSISPRECRLSRSRKMFVEKPSNPSPITIDHCVGSSIESNPSPSALFFATRALPSNRIAVIPPCRSLASLGCRVDVGGAGRRLREGKSEYAVELWAMDARQVVEQLLPELYRRTPPRLRSACSRYPGGGARKSC